MPTSRKFLPILLSAAAIFYIIFIARTAFDIHGQRAFTLVDDAMISMRYARNLAQGQGLVWNVGEAPIQGFTNLGWTLILAFFHLVPFSPLYISLAVMILAAFILLANTFIVYRIVEALDPSAQFAPLIAATITAFYFPLVFWSLRGLEVGALTLTVSLGILLTLKTLRGPQPASVFWLTLILGLALLIRMDAALPVGILVLYLASRNPRKAILPAIVSILVLAAILLFQKSYFGDFLPNTYYLKVNGVTAWERIRVGLLALNNYAARDFLMPLMFGLLGMALFKDLRTREALALLLLFFAQVAYSVWVGGDYAEELVDSANRFITQGMPALFILFALVMERFLHHPFALWEIARARAFLAFAIGLGALLIVSGEPWATWTLSNAPMLRTDIQRAKLGLHIQQSTDADAVIAVHAAGQIPYFSERTTIDLLGKSDVYIAKGPPATDFVPGHNKWNYAYSILELKPDVIADNFNKLAAFMDDHPEYVRLPNGIYVRADTTKVDVKKLGADYKD
ncbi:MAG: hypothetical protein HY869_09270 [Chloroflexi bacterium]|nr:hypothetical protein [Chloroflexota bacterium]